MNSSMLVDDGSLRRKSPEEAEEDREVREEAGKHLQFDSGEKERAILHTAAITLSGSLIGGF